MSADARRTDAPSKGTSPRDRMSPKARMAWERVWERHRGAFEKLAKL